MKKIIVLSTLLAMLFSLVGCDNFLVPMGLSGSDEGISNQSKSNPSPEPPIGPGATPQGSSASETKKDGYWERYDLQMIVPEDQTTGDGNPTIEYEFSSSNGSIGLSTHRTGKDGSVELIQTSGGWTIPEEEYFAGHPIQIKLTANIDKFNRVWTNFIGVNAYAYLGSESTAIGLATNLSLRDNNGKGTCSATINDGKITVGQATKEVKIVAPKGSGKEIMTIVVSVSNQGKLGGAKYFYKWIDW